MSTERTSIPFWTRKEVGCCGLVLFCLMLAWFLAQLAMKAVMRSVNQGTEMRVMRHLADGMIRYKAEYGHWPPCISKDGDALDLEIRSRGRLIYFLVNLHSPNEASSVPWVDENPRDIKFFDAPIANNGRYFGLVSNGSYSDPEPDSIRLVDIWGEDYHIIIDLNGDGEIANPAAGRVSGGFLFKKKVVPAKIAATVVVYSSGPDRDPKTWEDNILIVRK